MPALDTILLKANLMEDMRSKVWAAFMDSFITWAQHSGQDTWADPDATGEWVTSVIAKDLAMSHNYYVTPDMQVLVTAAAEKMDPEEPLRATDFPTEAGWLLIPGGVVHLDVRGLPTPISAVLWRVVGGVVSFTLFIDKTHPADQARWAQDAEIHKMLPRLTPVHLAAQPLDQPIHQVLVLGGMIPPEVSHQIEFTRDPETNNVSMSFPVGFDPSDLAPHHEQSPPIRWVVACLRLMMQPITDVTEQGLPANVRRQMARRQVRLRNTHVSVINFRRKVPHGDGAGREYSHRFLRRGHWRRQPYKPVPGGPWDYRTIYIHPTLVGDPSKPLLLREHVNSLSR